MLAELPKNLQALAVDRIFADDSQRLDGRKTGRDRGGDGHALGAHAGAVAGIVDGTASELARPARRVGGDTDGTTRLLRVRNVRLRLELEHVVHEISLVRRECAESLGDARRRREQVVDAASANVAVGVDDVEQHRVLAELAKNLAAHAAGRATGVLAADDCHVRETRVAFDDRRGGGVALGADGGGEGVVFDVAADESFAFAGVVDSDDGRSYREVGLEAVRLVRACPSSRDEITLDLVEPAVQRELSKRCGH